MAKISADKGSSFDVTEEKRETLGLHWHDILFVAIGLLLLFLLISPLPAGWQAIGLGGIVIRTKDIIIFLLIVLYLQRTIVRFDDYERGVVLRLGKFNRVVGPGWALVFPLLEKYFKVDIRLQVLSMAPQEVVTRDKVRFVMDPEIFVYVTDPKKAILNVDDYKQTLIDYVDSSLTHTAGNSSSDYIITHMDDLTHDLEDRVKEIANEPGKEWGIKIVKIKLDLVRFPDTVQDAMHEKVASEQLKLAAHEKAEATKIEIDAVREAGSKLTDPAITYMYLQALDKVARGRATKIVLPLEVTKIAETITKSTEGSTEEMPTDLPLQIVQKYKDVISDYEERLGDIEEQLDHKEEGEEEAPLEDKREEEEEVEEEEEPEEEEEEEVDYDEKIKEIKEKFGIED